MVIVICKLLLLSYYFKLIKILFASMKKKMQWIDTVQCTPIILLLLLKAENYCPKIETKEQAS